MKEDQGTIGRWADETFGEGTVKTRSLRLLKEVFELCEAAGACLQEIDDAYYETLKDIPKADPAKVPGELADCYIVLATIAHTVGANLEFEVEKKMAINRERKWKNTGGGCGQHEE